MKGVMSGYSRAIHAEMISSHLEIHPFMISYLFRMSTFFVFVLMNCEHVCVDQYCFDDQAVLQALCEDAEE